MEYHTHLLMPAGLECKKELGYLQSMKLEVQGKAVLKNAEAEMDKHIQILTKWYTRIMMRMAYMFINFLMFSRQGLM